VAKGSAATSARRRSDDAGVRQGFARGTYQQVVPIAPDVDPVAEAAAADAPLAPEAALLAQRRCCSP
jgi:hypothetical protein